MKKHFGYGLVNRSGVRDSDIVHSTIKNANTYNSLRDSQFFRYHAHVVEVFFEDEESGKLELHPRERVSVSREALHTILRAVLDSNPSELNSIRRDFRYEVENNALRKLLEEYNIEVQKRK